MIRPYSWDQIGDMIIFHFFNMPDEYAHIMQVRRPTGKYVYLHQNGVGYTHILPHDANTFISEIVGYPVYGGLFPKILEEDLPKVLDALCIPKDMGISCYIRLNNDNWAIYSLGGTKEIFDSCVAAIGAKYNPYEDKELFLGRNPYAKLQEAIIAWESYKNISKDIIYLSLP